MYSTTYYGEYGGCFVPELLMPPLLEVDQAMRDIMPTKEFQDELHDLLFNYAGRPTPLTFCPNLSKELGFNLWLKREDLLHTGAHKMNNTLGQALLAKKMGKTALIAETGAGQHGVATAAAAARLGLKCTIFMGAEDTQRQTMNVMRMEVFGATVHAVDSGTRTLKDAINEALRCWISNQETTHYCFGTAAGPAPFPELVAQFQSIVGKEARKQILEQTGKLPDAVVACVGGGSNAIGIFRGFLGDESVRLIGAEAAGSGESGCFNSASLNLGSPGVLHGNRTLLLQTPEGQIEPSHSVAAGLDYPGVGPEHAHLHDIGRAEYVPVTDDEAVNAFEYLAKTEGIIPAIESAHAVAHAMKLAPAMDKGQIIVITISGRGDKDCAAIARYRGEDLHE